MGKELYRGEAVIERKGDRIYIRIGDAKLAKELDKNTVWGTKTGIVFKFYFRWPVPIEKSRV